DVQPGSTFQLVRVLIPNQSTSHRRHGGIALPLDVASPEVDLPPPHQIIAVFSRLVECDLCPEPQPVQEILGPRSDSIVLEVDLSLAGAIAPFNDIAKLRYREPHPESGISRDR